MSYDSKKNKKSASYDDYLKKQLEDPLFAQLWEEEQPEIQFRLALIEAREESGLTQKELAEAAGMKQESISRLERGDSKPTLNTMKRLAAGLNRELVIKFKPIAQ